MQLQQIQPKMARARKSKAQKHYKKIAVLKYVGLKHNTINKVHLYNGILKQPTNLEHYCMLSYISGIVEQK